MLLRFGTAKKKGLSLADRCHSCEKKEEKQSCQLPAVTSVVQWQIRFGFSPSPVQCVVGLPKSVGLFVYLQFELNFLN